MVFAGIGWSSPDREKPTIDMRMVVVGIVVGVLCLGLLIGTGAMLYELAPFAMPVMVGTALARFASSHGFGWLVAGAVGLLSGAVLYFLALGLVAALRPPMLHIAALLAFSLPAGVATYIQLEDFTRTFPDKGWRTALCGGGALVMGALAFVQVLRGAGDGCEDDNGGG